MSTPTADAVQRSVEVLVPVEQAWSVFTEEMGSWWPLATHSLGADEGTSPDDVVMEGRLGGSIYEVIGSDRREWGVVAEWDPPTRLAVDWVLGGDVATRWTATFSPTARGTRVELVHAGFDAHGDRAPVLREAYGADGGWTLVLDRFATVVNASPTGRGAT